MPSHWAYCHSSRDFFYVHLEVDFEAVNSLDRRIIIEGARSVGMMRWHLWAKLIYSEERDQGSTLYFSPAERSEIGEN